MWFSEFREAIRPYRRIAVVSHTRPDADALGSQAALCMWLRHQGHSVTAFNDDAPPRNLRWIEDRFPIRQTDALKLGQAQAYIVVDGNALHRFGEAGRHIGLSHKPVFMIDHHPQPDEGFTLMVNRPEVSSTCQLIAHLYEETGWEGLTLSVAESLYAGMMTDTGSFRFDSVDHHTHRLTGELIERTGLKVDKVHRWIFDGRSLDQLLLLGDVLGTLQLHADGRIATFAVSQEMLRRRHCAYPDLDGMVNYGLGLQGVQASIMACELDHRVKLSMRSIEPVDVNRWARKFEGGGHARASGAWHAGPLERTITAVVDEGMRHLF